MTGRSRYCIMVETEGVLDMVKKEESPKNTNIFDVLVALINFISNVFSAKKVIAISVLYMVVVQNLILILRENSNLERYSYKANAAAIITAFINAQQPLVIVILSAVVVVLLIAVISLIIHTRVLRKEINRLSKERSDLMHHPHKTIHTHRSSGEE